MFGYADGSGDVIRIDQVERVMAHRVYVAGTCDTKAAELRYVCDLIAAQGLSVCLVDVSTSGLPAGSDVALAEVRPDEVAGHHPNGAAEVFTGDRGRSVSAMAIAFQRFLQGRDDVGGLLGLGGSGGAALIAPSMRGLAVGVPKLLVCTMAAGNVAPYVGASDIAMLYPVTDLAGLNRISRRVLANAAHAMAGMVLAPLPEPAADRPAVGITMFGVTTLCVNRLVVSLEADHDCLVFHATGAGGQSMEKLADSGLLAGVIDVTTTELCDLLFGGVLACTEDRLGAIARSQVPYVGSCGALDMVNFGARDSLPTRYADRILYEHNAEVTLMRTTPTENAQVGRWIGERLNRCGGPVRFLLPTGGVSALAVPGEPFHDPAADEALFTAIEESVRQTDRRRVLRVPAAINEPAFAEALLEQFYAVTASAPPAASRPHPQ